ncbi:hypothetical protein CA267_014285 [Alteromonas pelagimontana]|uniref:Glycosyl hydrolase family 32 N-terminal domain-containing protein n=1 Tax=Alteromonas pelagimontana TaxID=1858656 RepID=A0A6M4MFI1_9ALTE|nr:hypothetical protein [Alteromonas pelagimontana]QJR81843.1 hypothetical protein CA267_014285 [Alteromonas pelagimontana]
MKSQKWQKLGQIFSSSNLGSHFASHASLPMAVRLQGNQYEVYFSSRDLNNVSYTTSIRMDMTMPVNTMGLPTQVILGPGDLGTFDDSGAMATWFTSYKQKNYLYYIGWNLGKTVPFRNAIGLAVSDNRTDFERIAAGPILDRSLYEPHFCASCCVIPGDDKWRMWYLSCTEWRMNNGYPEHRYHIKYAESQDGIHWIRNGIIAIDFADKNEIAISRPSVLFYQGLWRMWFSFRQSGNSYRIGYAESADGITWKRSPDPVLDVSKHGWDSQMVEYPYVFSHSGKLYMLYNGNDYGRTGFGIAALEKL